jgi:hypothetical protein
MPRVRGGTVNYLKMTIIFCLGDRSRDEGF